MRSRLAEYWDFLWVIGIISACAEQTDSTASNDGADWDHLRVCGADVAVAYLDEG